MKRLLSILAVPVNWLLDTQLDKTLCRAINDLTPPEDDA